jgi:hypothetical protein
MSRASGLPARRTNPIELEGILLGAVRAGDGTPAGTRDGSARVLSKKLNSTMGFKVLLQGATAAAAGGYVIEVDHVPFGTSTPSGNWTPVGIISASGLSEVEALISGKDVGVKVAAAAGVIDPNVKAIRATPGSGDIAITNVNMATNVATITVAAHPFQVGDTVTVAGCNIAQYNGTWRVTARTATTFSYSRPGGTGNTAVATGNVTNGAQVPSNVGTIWVAPLFAQR